MRSTEPGQVRGAGGCRNANSHQAFRRALVVAAASRLAPAAEQGVLKRGPPGRCPCPSRPWDHGAPSWGTATGGTCSSSRSGKRGGMHPQFHAEQRRMSKNRRGGHFALPAGLQLGSTLPPRFATAVSASSPPVTLALAAPEAAREAAEDGPQVDLNHAQKASPRAVPRRCAGDVSAGRPPQRHGPSGSVRPSAAGSFPLSAFRRPGPEGRKPSSS